LIIKRDGSVTCFHGKIVVALQVIGKECHAAQVSLLHGSRQGLAEEVVEQDVAQEYFFPADDWREEPDESKSGAIGEGMLPVGCALGRALDSGRRIVSTEAQRRGCAVPRSAPRGGRLSAPAPPPPGSVSQPCSRPVFPEGTQPPQ